MDHKTMSRHCPWRVVLRESWYCKALVGQPNEAHCCESNCACLHIANILVQEVKEELFR